MIIGFMIWSIVAIMFAGIGISSRKSEKAVGFFTFVGPPVVRDVKKYNHAVSILWFTAAVLFEIIGIPFLIAEQNSPIFIVTVLAVMALVISMMIAFFQIEARYRA